MGDLTGFRFTRDHEWACLSSPHYMMVGVSQHAQDLLGDVVFVELPPVGKRFAAGDSLAEVESTKTASSVLAPLAGTVVEVNTALDANPQWVNSDPYGDGWLVVLAPDDPGVFDELMDSAAYTAYLQDVAG